jgi:hypothetical protein
MKSMAAIIFSFAGLFIAMPADGQQQGNPIVDCKAHTCIRMFGGFLVFPDGLIISASESGVTRASNLYHVNELMYAPGFSLSAQRQSAEYSRMLETEAAMRPCFRFKKYVLRNELPASMHSVVLSDGKDVLHIVSEEKIDLRAILGWFSKKYPDGACDFDE